MKKVILIPLDERPCNYDFPKKLFDGEEIQLIRPDKGILGDKKKSADLDKICSFLLETATLADGLIVSMEMLLYGGLLPSRIHYYTESEVTSRLGILRQLKQLNPKLIIYAFGLIMRCPTYSNADEEPDYYDICGAEIHRVGVLRHKASLGLISQEDAELEIAAMDKLDHNALEDYISRRQFNLNFNSNTLWMVKEGVIDYYVIPQDDSSKYGFTAIDQGVLRTEIKSLGLQFKVSMYPGADEIALTLLARILNHFQQKTPQVFIKYAAVNAEMLIPSYEDRPLGETLKHHIIASGCTIAECPCHADIILCITAPAKDMGEALYQGGKNLNYDVDRNIAEQVLYAEQAIKEGKHIVFADNAYANGADLELITMLNNRGLLLNLSGYAGWNTSSNTIGTALAQGIVCWYEGKTSRHSDFLVLRYLEDAGYCSVVRKEISDNYLDKLGYNYFDVKDRQGKVSDLASDLLKSFASQYLSSINDGISIKDTSMPWRRMFEIDICAHYTEKK